jgi:hypothetical protein
MSDPGWRDVLLALLGAWPGRLDEMTATAWLHEVQARGGRDPEAVLQALRATGGDHPPSAPAVAQIVLRDGQPDPPSFEAVIAFVGADDRVAHPYPAMRSRPMWRSSPASAMRRRRAGWPTRHSGAALEVPDGRAIRSTSGQRIRLRDHERGYREHVRGVALVASARRGCGSCPAFGTR